MVGRLIIASASQWMTNYPGKGRGQVTQTIKILVVTNEISSTVVARVIKFCTQVGYIMTLSQHIDDKSSVWGRGQDHVTHFNFGAPKISLERLKLESSGFALRSY